MQTDSNLQRPMRILSRLSIPGSHQKWLLATTLLVAIASLWKPHQPAPLGRIELPSWSVKSKSNQVETPPAITETNAEAPILPPNNEYQIVSGDTLGAIFTRLQLSHSQMNGILEADQTLVLDTLKPGNTLKFWLDTELNVDKMQVMFHPGYYVDFTHISGQDYETKEVIIDGDWQRRVLGGEIQGNLYISARKAGLSPAQIEQINRLFKDKIDFARSLRAGDEFRVIMEEQYIDGKATGENRMLGVNILNRGRQLNAFLFDDGNYYDSEGQSLAQAFTRHPVKGNARISSHFNPKRKHPVTGRISPHNGTDFAVSTGTPVYATGDGVVTRVIRHPYAGLYIVLQHGSSYRTRFLHLSKALVKKGQTVTRGQKIALSGNSGRSTGPHLHYEFHINGRPVNPMRAKIPMAASVAKSDMSAFKQTSQQLLAAMLEY